ncbi:NTP transferase domain-containing protein [bacterium]|nr:NTP transferase domain-containing protein [bacterium]
MTERAELIQRKEEVIRQLAAARRRLDNVTGVRQRAAVESEIQDLQAQERALRLVIDQAPIPMTPSLRSKSLSQTKFDVLMTAGYDRNKADPLAEVTGQPQKVMVEVADAPMIWHVVRSLEESGLIDEIVIVGLDKEHHLDFGRPVHFVDDHGSMTANQRAGAEYLASLNDQNRYVLAMGADTPLLTGEMVRWFIDACHPLQRDIYWGVVSQTVMEGTFPLSKRSYLRLSEGKFCSGDLFLVDLEVGLRAHKRMEPYFNSRKNILQQLRMLGFSTILAFLFGRLSLTGLLKVVEREVDATGAAVQLAFAEPGMDVDKPHQLVQVKEYLAGHPDHPANQRRYARGEDA